MRSLTQAALVLLFMFRASWRLTVITFILIPLSVSVSKTFGTWFRWGARTGLQHSLQMSSSSSSGRAPVMSNT